MTLPIHLIDAFAEAPFTGNPAGVVRLNQTAPEHWMQQVAMELNQAETAFLQHQHDNLWQLRWFTPRAEVALCGHATMAAAHFLWEQRHQRPEEVIHFSTRSGRLAATRDSTGVITIELPAINSIPATPPADLSAALALTPEAVLMGDYDLMVVARNAATVRNLEPDHLLIARWPVRGLVVTAPSDQTGVDFISRCFYPALGIPEDPVTGSAHAALAPWWAQRLGRATLTGRQESSRGGIVRCEIAGDRVRLSGGAVTTLRGRLPAPQPDSL